VNVGMNNSSRPSGADTRQRILVAAVELFSANGYAGTSVRDIADALGMTKAALYYHFAGKEEILQAVTAPLHEDMDDLFRWAAAQPRPDPAELLTALVNLVSRHGPLLSSVFGDPSVIRRHVPNERSMAAMAGLETMLAGSAEPVQLLRARCALGAIFGGVHGIAKHDTRFTEPRGEQAARLLNREEELLDAGQRQEIVAAALRALGAAGAFTGPDGLPGSAPVPQPGPGPAATCVTVPGRRDLPARPSSAAQAGAAPSPDD
jgi:AcrR family transcriptional regulator